jgi:putative spermidine/putrescine transport system substrate-binding protein
MAAAVGGLPGRLSAQSAGELRFLFPGGSWKEWFEKTFAEPFASSTNTKLVWKTGSSLGTLATAQRSRPQWDLVHVNHSEASQMGAMSVAAELKEDRIPNIAKVHPSFRTSHLVGKVHTPYGIAVNTKRIKKPITSWFDLWDPEFAGKVGWPGWEWGGVGEDVFHTINILAGGDPTNIDPGIARMKALYKTNKAQNVQNNEQMKQLLLAEEVWIAPLFGARTEQAKAAGAPLEWIVPKEGGLTWAWNVAMIARRPKESTELAERFINTTLDPERQIAFSRLTGYPPTNLDAIANLPPDLQKLRLSQADLEGIGRLQSQFDYVAQFALRDQNRERWNKEVIGG